MAISKLSSAIDWVHASWEEGCRAVEQFTDRLGRGIDPGIFETVVALNLLGLRTAQSCEGHFDHGSAYPWITVIDAERERQFTARWVQVCDLEEQARGAGTEEAYDRFLNADMQLRLTIAQWERDDPVYQRLAGLLDAFYADRPETPLHLLIKRFKSPGAYRIAPGFSPVIQELPAHLKERYLARGQAEMQAFTRFLKGQWQEKAAADGGQ